MAICVAVVEDEKRERELIKKYLASFGEERGVVFNVYEFEDGLSFLSDYKSIYDVVFMDIEMPHLSGMEAAKRLRKLDDKVALVFITNMAQYAVGGYEVDAMSFIVKPVTYSNFAMKLSRVMDKVNTDKKPFVLIKGKNNFKRVGVDEIRYVEVANHSLVWHTKSGKEQSTGSLKSVKEELGNSFAFCNQCYLVNLRFCEEVSVYTVTVAGEVLQISRPKRASFIKALNMFLNE